jgi:4-hydroxy-tetrahydrodipicolinate synthase
MRLLEQGGKFVQSIKFGCELAGLPAGPVRKPMRSLEEDQRRELESTIRTLKAVIASIEGKFSRKVAKNVIAINA